MTTEMDAVTDEYSPHDFRRDDGGNPLLGRVSKRERERDCESEMEGEPRGVLERLLSVVASFTISSR